MRAFLWYSKRKKKFAEKWCLIRELWKESKHRKSFQNTIQYFNVVMVNEIKSNLQSQFESFAEFVDKCRLWSVKAEKISKEKLLKQPKFENSLICRRELRCWLLRTVLRIWSVKFSNSFSYFWHKRHA
jgi:5-methylthioribose kinase